MMTMQLLRDQLHRCISNRENADRQTSCKADYKGLVGSMWSTSQVTQFYWCITVWNQTTAESHWKKKMICICCSGQHWSDECQTFPTVTARKEKIKAHCFICLKQVTNRKIVQWRSRVFIANKEIVTTEVSALRSFLLRSPQKWHILLLNPYLLLLLKNIPCCPLKSKCWCKLPLLK